MNFNILFFLLGLFTSCKLDNHKFTVIESQGLNAENLGLRDLAFYSNKVGFIVGNSDLVEHNTNEQSDTFAFVKSKALLYKTEDGGSTWTERTFGEGSLNGVVIFGRKIFVIKTSDEDYSSTVYISSDLGNSWKKDFSFPKVVSDILTVNDKFYIVAKDHDDVFRIFERNTDTWSPIQLPFTIYSVVLNNGLLYFLSSADPKTYSKNLLVEYDFRKKTTRTFNLPKDYDGYFLSPANKNICVVGLKSNHIVGFELFNSEYIKTTFVYNDETGLFPQGYYVRDNKSWIVVGKRESYGVSNKILESTNSGKDWETIDFVDNKTVKPFFFLTDNSNKVRAYFYSGSGRFQILQNQ
jgi:hypothetical protein